MVRYIDEKEEISRAKLSIISDTIDQMRCSIMELDTGIRMLTTELERKDLLIKADADKIVSYITNLSKVLGLKKDSLESLVNSLKQYGGDNHENT